MGIEAFLDRLRRRLRRRPAPRAQALHPLQAARDRVPGRRWPRPGIRVGAELEAYEPVGCARCNQSGYRGRVGIYSVMTMSERIKEMTVDQAPEAEIAAVAREEGMLTLREDGVVKVRGGPDQPRGGPPCHRLSARIPVSGIEESAADGRSRRHGFRLLRGPAPHGRGEGLRRPPDRRACRPRSATRARSRRWRASRCSPDRRPARSSTASSTTTSANASRTTNSSTSPTRSPASPASASTASSSAARSAPPSASSRRRSPRSTRSACRRCCVSSPPNRAASSSSPARPARASRRPWRR